MKEEYYAYGVIALIAIIAIYYYTTRQGATTTTQGTMSNPFPYNMGWKGAGYYSVALTYLYDQNAYNDIGLETPPASGTVTYPLNLVNQGTMSNPYRFEKGWQGAGYYTISFVYLQDLNAYNDVGLGF